MTKANDLASLLDANGDVVSSALDNVPANPTLTSLGIPNHDDITVDGSGNVLVGTTDTTVYDNNANSSADNGLNLRGDGKLDAARYNAPVLGLNRTGTDGTLAEFRRSGTVVGSIASRSGVSSYFVGDPRTSGAGGASIHPLGGVTPTLRAGDQTTFQDNYMDLGSSVYRWKDLYLSGGVYLGGTGSANKLDSYEEGSFAPVLAGTGITGTGNYVKVGNIVHFDMSFSSNAGISGHTGIITGLPFTSTASEYPSNGHIGRLYGVTLSNPAYVLRAYNYEIAMMYIGGNNNTQGFTQTNSTVRIGITASIRVA